jgi:hypothetical protein
VWLTRMQNVTPTPPLAPLWAGFVPREPAESLVFAGAKINIRSTTGEDFDLRRPQKSFGGPLGRGWLEMLLRERISNPY